VLALIAAVVCDPLVATEPDQPPDAVQEDALVADQVRFEVPPCATLEGLAPSEITGGGETVTVADWDAVPPVPVQLRVNLVVAVREAVACDPAVGCDPLQPSEALQEVAFLDDQVSVDVAPLFTVVGLAVNVTVGVGAVTETVADCAAVPPAPVHVSV
jgi:hypothetical protein